MFFYVYLSREHVLLLSVSHDRSLFAKAEPMMPDLNQSTSSIYSDYCLGASFNLLAVLSQINQSVLRVSLDFWK